jgi:AbiEi antitoxin C-terminal domain
MRRQDGVAGVEQLRGSGFTDKAIRGLVGRGLLVRHHRGVYVDALAPLAVRGHLFAALLACNDTAFLSHRTAAAFHGLRALNVRAIEVTVVAEHTPSHKGLIVHRTSRTPLPNEVRIFDGLRIASPSRTLVDLAGHENAQELARLIA